MVVMVIAASSQVPPAVPEKANSWIDFGPNRPTKFGLVWDARVSILATIWVTHSPCIYSTLSWLGI